MSVRTRDSNAALDPAISRALEQNLFEDDGSRHDGTLAARQLSPAGNQALGGPLKNDNLHFDQGQGTNGTGQMQVERERVVHSSGLNKPPGLAPHQTFGIAAFHAWQNFGSGYSEAQLN